MTPVWIPIATMLGLLAVRFVPDLWCDLKEKIRDRKLRKEQYQKLLRYLTCYGAEITHRTYLNGGLIEIGPQNSGVTSELKDSYDGYILDYPYSDDSNIRYYNSQFEGRILIDLSLWQKLCLASKIENLKHFEEALDEYRSTGKVKVSDFRYRDGWTRHK